MFNFFIYEAKIMSKTINYNNWYNKPNHLTHSFNKPNSYNPNVISIKEFHKREVQKVIEFHKNEYRNYLKTLTNDVIRIEFSEIAFQYHKYDNIIRIEFPYDMKEILNDVVNLEFNIIEETKTIYDIEEPEIVQNDDTLSQNQLIERLNYKTQCLFDVVNTYDTYMNLLDDSMKRVILKKVFKLTHSINTRYTEKKLNNWCDNFINMIDDKVRIFKKKQNKKLRSKKQLAYDNTYEQRASTFRQNNIVSHMMALGYHGFNEDGIWGWMEEKLTDQAIYNKLIAEFDAINQDHDMLERINQEERIYNENMDIFKHHNGDD